jgi:hypothetical protein
MNFVAVERDGELDENRLRVAVARAERVCVNE